MKLRLLSALCVGAFALASISEAQDISVEPGEWKYSANGVMGPIPLSENGTGCVVPEQASVNLDEFVKGVLDASCSISDVEQDGGKLTAVLTCDETVLLTADLDMELTDAAARVNVTGEMKVSEGVAFPVDLSGTAVRLGECSG